MKIAYPKTILAVALGALLATPSPAEARPKLKTVATPTALSQDAPIGARSLINEGCMTNEEARAVAIVMADRQRRQDEETKGYEIFKFNRELLLARASAPSITIDNGSPLGEVEKPTSFSRATWGRRESKTTGRLTAMARVAVRDDMAAPDREATPAPSTAGAAVQIANDLPIRQLMTYPAKYFRKLSMEKDSAQSADAQAKKELLEFLVGDQKDPIQLQEATENTGSSRESQFRR